MNVVSVHVSLCLFPLVFSGQTVFLGKISGNCVRLGQHSTVHFQDGYMAKGRGYMNER